MLCQHYRSSGPCVQHAAWHRPPSLVSCQKRKGKISLTSTLAAATTSLVPTVAHSTLPAPQGAHFEENSTVFVEEFRIRGNEAGPDQRANIITIANLLQVRNHDDGASLFVLESGCSLYGVTMQEIGGNHGVAMWGRASSGFAAMPGMDHLIFVATRMQIRMVAYPNW